MRQVRAHFSNAGRIAWLYSGRSVRATSPRVAGNLSSDCESPARSGWTLSAKALLVLEYSRERSWLGNLDSKPVYARDPPPAWKAKGFAAPIGTLCASFVDHICAPVKGAQCDLISQGLSSI